MIRIHHVPRTRSMRVIWLCEELDLAYEIVPVDFSPAYRSTPEWRALSPTGKVPAMEDDGFSMFESGAMVDYILERYGEGRLQPKQGTEASAHYRQWCWFAEATLARPLGDIVHHTLIKPEAERIPAVAEDAHKRALLCIDAIEAHLDGRDYLVGDFSAADIMMGYSLALAVRVGALEDRHPRVSEYLGRLEERPGFGKGLV